MSAGELRACDISDEQLVAVCIDAEERDMAELRATRPSVYLSILKKKIENLQKEVYSLHHELIPPYQLVWWEEELDRDYKTMLWERYDEREKRLKELKVLYGAEKVFLEESGALADELIMETAQEI